MAVRNRVCRCVSFQISGEVERIHEYEISYSCVEFVGLVESSLACPIRQEGIYGRAACGCSQYGGTVNLNGEVPKAGKDGYKGLPPGEYMLAYVPEKLGEHDVKVTLAVEDSKTGDATFKP
jgi:hypothetical protein